MNDDILLALGCLLARPDDADLRGYKRSVGYECRTYGGIERVIAATVAVETCGRGRIVTHQGAPDRRSSVFLPLVTRWAARHYMMRDGAL